ncbi:MAG: hypothetical protein HDQ95_16270 [Roseburia sp.]|nr:hypothetical protein [Roseburia sp.]
MVHETYHYKHIVLIIFVFLAFEEYFFGIFGIVENVVDPMLYPTSKAIVRSIPSQKMVVAEFMESADSRYGIKGWKGGETNETDYRAIWEIFTGRNDSGYIADALVCWDT